MAWSDHSIASDFVREEAGEGRDRGVLIPVRLDTVKPPFGFRTIHSADLSNWDGSADAAEIVELLPHLARKLGDAPTIDQPTVASPSEPAPITDRSSSGERTFRDHLGDGSQGPLMVRIPAGRFVMGSPDSETDRSEYEGPTHTVSIRAFAMGCYPVTFEEYDLFADATGRDKPDDENWGRGNRPVINVSWDDAAAYTQWLSEQTGKPYRLPTEAEWEYAARAGTTTRYWWGDEFESKRANCSDSGSGQTSPVDAYAPNPWGLHDTAGNVSEWVQDCWHDGYDNAPKDGSAWKEKGGGDCSRRMIRGGSWGDTQSYFRSSDRSRNFADYRSNYIGFRLAQDL